jgi:FtsP/CotA-like multicopper oxidase with cupredoxin domain
MNNSELLCRGTPGVPFIGVAAPVAGQLRLALVVFCTLFAPLASSAPQSSINVQCPTETILHPSTTDNDGIKCLHLEAGDGMVTMADNHYRDTDGSVVNAGKPLYIFSFSTLGPTLPGDAQPDPGMIMQDGLLAANAPAPTIFVDEDDEFFLSLTNVGMAMRPDLFDEHTVHWHGFPNAASVFDGVPDSSIFIAMGATLTYYYHAVDAGTYMYHCHVEAAEHMQMGMLGNLYVRPRQNKLTPGTPLATAFATNRANIANGGTTPAPAANTAVHAAGATYAYNDGDGTTRYDVEYPILIGSFDPDFHDASLAVQPLPFAGMRDRYFLLNGRGYPDTARAGALPETLDPLGNGHTSQPVSTLIQAQPGQKILLRIANLSVTEFYTLGTSGVDMEVVALDARLLRDGDGNNMYYTTNSVTLGGGQSADVIVTAPATAGTYFLYTKNLDRLANDAENLGGMMTEIRVGSI